MHLCSLLLADTPARFSSKIVAGGKILLFFIIPKAPQITEKRGRAIHPERPTPFVFLSTLHAPLSALGLYAPARFFSRMAISSPLPFIPRIFVGVGSPAG